MESTKPQTSTREKKFSYGKDLFIPNVPGPGEPQLVEPDFEPERGSMFEAFPQGLDIDGKTGVINIDTSEAGIKYKVVYANSSKEKKHAKLTISGIDYKSGLFGHENEKNLVKPIFDFNPKKSVIGYYDQPEKIGRFDVRPASDFGLEINKTNGTIDLAKTIENLRALNEPLDNGYSKEFIITYKVQETVGDIKVVVYYYNKEKEELEDTLAQLKSLIHFKNNIDTSKDAKAMTFAVSPNGLTASSDAAARRRPPHLVIVQ